MATQRSTIQLIEDLKTYIDLLNDTLNELELRPTSIQIYPKTPSDAARLVPFATDVRTRLYEHKIVTTMDLAPGVVLYSDREPLPGEVEAYLSTEERIEHHKKQIDTLERERARVFAADKV